MSGHVSFHAAVGRKHHVAEAAEVLLHTGVSPDVSLQHST